ncbi:hypothetical protein ACOSQ4_021601 [Xanthoceras sorbifolium]
MKAPIEDPMAILQKGYSVTIVLAVLTFGAVAALYFRSGSPSIILTTSTSMHIISLAKPLVNEVRRQFIERPSIMEYKKKLDYRHCIAIVAFVSLW